MLRNFLTASVVAILGTTVVAQSPMVQGCFPGTSGIIHCPCGQPSNPAGGCDNFGGGPSLGGVLDATGSASLMTDTVVLDATGLNGMVKTYFYTGTGSLNTGIPHGAGVRCVSINLKVLYPTAKPYGNGFWAWLIWLLTSKNAISSSGGAISRPRPMFDHSVSERSKELGAPISAGQTRHYWVMYQDPLAATPCGNSVSVVNLTNVGSITWGP